jgi:Ca2+:H+ antiporter
VDEQRVNQASSPETRRSFGGGVAASISAAGRPRWYSPDRWGGLKALLIFVPIALLFHAFHLPPIWQFSASLLALLPLAALMGEATEHLAHRAGPGIGGLLNATFGNAAELIIALALLFKGKDTVVKASITGSILGNILLVLGASLFAGGLKHATQRFNRTAAGVGATMMALAAIGMLIPAIFHSLPEVVHLGPNQSLNLEHKLSLTVSVALMAAYGLSLLFSLKTHKNLYNPLDESAVEFEGATTPAAIVWTIRRSLSVLLASTVFVGLLSEVMARSMEEAGKSLGLTEVFLGVVVIAIVGNAAEHSSAVLVALKNKMDLSVGIALGSALQVALFVAPTLVFASYLRPRPMDLLFTTMEVVAVAFAVMIARMVAEDGESNWLEGAMLLMVYLILAIVFFYLPPESAPATSAPTLIPATAAGSADSLATAS